MSRAPCWNWRPSCPALHRPGDRDCGSDASRDHGGRAGVVRIPGAVIATGVAPTSHPGRCEFGGIATGAARASRPGALRVSVGATRVAMAAAGSGGADSGRRDRDWRRSCVQPRALRVLEGSRLASLVRQGRERYGFLWERRKSRWRRQGRGGADSGRRDRDWRRSYVPPRALRVLGGSRLASLLHARPGVTRFGGGRFSAARA